MCKIYTYLFKMKSQYCYKIFLNVAYIHFELGWQSCGFRQHSEAEPQEPGADHHRCENGAQRKVLLCGE